MLGLVTGGGGRGFRNFEKEVCGGKGECMLLQIFDGASRVQEFNIKLKGDF